MFDVVVAKCPSCGGEVEFQSKAGDCELRVYTQESVPACISVDLAGATETCECGEALRIQAEVPIARVAMFVTKVSDENPDDTDWD